MSDSKIYSVIVNYDGTHAFYGTFNDRRLMLESLRNNVDLNGAYIQGETKKLDITPITIFNGFVKNGLIIYKDDNNQQKWFIKILIHKLNEVNPLFYKMQNATIF